MKTAWITGLLLFQFTVLLAAAPIGKAAAPPLLPVQGYLTDDSDAPLNGFYKISFALFDAGTAGTSLFTTTEPVMVTKGRFTAYLGDKQQLQLDKLHLANAVWLEVTIVQSCAGDATCASPIAVNKTLSPRLQLASTAYAASAAFCSSADNAQALGGMSVSELQPKIVDVACGPNKFVAGIQGGMPVCASAPVAPSSGTIPVQSTLPDVNCPPGRILSGIQGGEPVCLPLPMDGKDGANGKDGMDGKDATLGGTVAGDLTISGTLNVGLYRSHGPPCNFNNTYYDCTCDRGGYAISGGAEPQTGGRVTISSPLDGGGWRVGCQDGGGVSARCGYINLVCARLK